MAKRSDATLVASTVAGDREAMAVIWDRYSGLVRGVLYGALGPDQAIEDLVQDVFLAFIRSAGRVQDGAALRGYLATVAVRLARMEIRKRKVRHWVGLTPTGELPDLAVLPLDVESREALRALHRVLSRLSDRRRLVFILRQVQGLEILEVTEALGISESTLRRELGVARDFIKNAATGESALSGFAVQEQGDGS